MVFPANLNSTPIVEASIAMVVSTSTITNGDRKLLNVGLVKKFF
jgi:hypothetical protein